MYIIHITSLTLSSYYLYSTLASSVTCPYYILIPSCYHPCTIHIISSCHPYDILVPSLSDPYYILVSPLLVHPHSPQPNDQASHHSTLNLVRDSYERLFSVISHHNITIPERDRTIVSFAGMLGYPSSTPIPPHSIQHITNYISILPPTYYRNNIDI